MIKSRLESKVVRGAALLAARCLPLALRPALGSVLNLLLSASCVLVLAAMISQTAAAYDFPYTNPYLATITARLLQPEIKDNAAKPKEMLLRPLPGRDHVALFEGRDKAVVAVFVQSHKAPLVYVIPGMGGGGTDSAPEWLGQRYFLAGFNVIVLPSPMSWQFVLSQSTQAVPGFTPQDVTDLQRVMVSARQEAEHQYGMKVHREAVVGYSLGAIEAAYLMKAELAYPIVGVERALMIEPPLDLNYTIGVLDRMSAVGNQWTPKQRDILWGRVLDVGARLLSRDPSAPGYYLGLDKVLPATDDQYKYLIGDTFHQTLTEVIFVSQQIQNLGLLKEPATSGERTIRYLEAEKLSFLDYMKRAAQPFWSNQLHLNLTTEQFVSLGEVRTLLPLLTQDSSFYMIHNEDDFLNRPSDITLVAKAMGTRAVVFPTGGHVGNLWEPTVSHALITPFSDLFQ